MSLDGRASFSELKGRAGGSLVSRSREDRWMMDFLARTPRCAVDLRENAA